MNQSALPDRQVLLQCARCGWAHFGMSRAEAMAAVAEFNAAYSSSSPKAQAAYAGSFSLVAFETCRRCGASHTEARRVAASNMPKGVTLLLMIERLSEANHAL